MKTVLNLSTISFILHSCNKLLLMDSLIQKELFSLLNQKEKKSLNCDRYSFLNPYRFIFHASEFSIRITFNLLELICSHVFFFAASFFEKGLQFISSNILKSSKVYLNSKSQFFLSNSFLQHKELAMPNVPFMFNHYQNKVR